MWTGQKENNIQANYRWKLECFYKPSVKELHVQIVKMNIPFIDHERSTCPDPKKNIIISPPSGYLRQSRCKK